jgi:hypothetical protein
MTGRASPRRTSGTGHVRLVTIEQALAEAREDLDDFERRYGVPSDRMEEAFTDAAGRLRETGDFLRWSDTLARWQQLAHRTAS